jgi:hypothetical protein
MKSSVLLAAAIGGVALAVAIPARAGLADGLVAYYPLDGDANDASGNGYNGVVYGNTNWVPAVNRQGLQFDGVTTYVLVSNFTFQPRDQFSAAFWARPDTDSGTGQPRDFLSKHHDLEDMEFDIRMEDDGKYDSEWKIGDTFYDLTAIPGSNDQVGLVSPGFTNFDFITATYDGSVICFYVNGILKKQQPASGNISQSSYRLTIGAYAVNPLSEMFKGVMDDVRIYNRALSTNEVMQLYALGLPRLETFRQNGQLVLSWPTNFPALTLVSATNLGPDTVWIPVTNSPVAVDDRFFVTNSPANAKMFFRLQMP